MAIQAHPDTAATRDWYNRLSHVYDYLADSSERRARLMGLRLLTPRSAEHLLEIGFGTGQALVSLAHAVGPQGQVTGIDLSDRMVAVAQKRLERESVAGWVNLVCQDARRLPFAPATFDGAFMSFSLELFSEVDARAVLAEIRKVLKPDGRLVVVSLVKDSRRGISSRIYETLHRWLPKYIDCHPIELASELSENFKVQKTEDFQIWGIPGQAILALPR